MPRQRGGERRPRRRLIPRRSPGNPGPGRLRLSRVFRANVPFSGNHDLRTVLPADFACQASLQIRILKGEGKLCSQPRTELFSSRPAQAETRLLFEKTIDQPRDAATGHSQRFTVRGSRNRCPVPAPGHKPQATGCTLHAARCSRRVIPPAQYQILPAKSATCHSAQGEGGARCPGARLEANGYGLQAARCRLRAARCTLHAAPGG